MPKPSTTIPESKFGWVISLLFWICLMAAATIYGLVALSPKVLTYLKLEGKYRENQVRLIQLERQVEYFDKVAEALKTDPEFAQELARVDFDAVRPGEERIAVDRRLSLQAQPVAEPLPQPVGTLPWYTPTLRMFAEESQLRTVTLATAAALVILAFALFQDSAILETCTVARGSRKRRRCLWDRYRKR